MPSFQQAFILILLAFAMLADPVPEDLLPVLEKLYKVQPEAEKTIELHIQELRRPVSANQGNQQFKEISKLNHEAADRLDEQLKKAKRGEKPLMPQLGIQLQAGTVGTPYSRTCVVVQIRGPQEMLIRHHYVAQGIDPFNRTRIFPPPEDYQIMLRGVPTEGYAIDKAIELPEFIRVTENHFFRSDDGKANIVPLVEPLDMDRINSAWPAYVASKRRK